MRCLSFEGAQQSPLQAVHSPQAWCDEGQESHALSRHDQQDSDKTTTKNDDETSAIKTDNNYKAHQPLKF